MRAEDPPRPLPVGELDEVLARGDEPWSELRDARVFLSGGTGFFGRWLVELLLRASEVFGLRARAVLLTRSAATLTARAPHVTGHPAVTVVEGDVRDFRFPEGRFTHVVHGATSSTGPLGAEQPLAMFDTVALGTRRCLDLAVDTGATRFLFIGSGAVYGRQPPDLSHVPEEYAGAPDPLDPLAVYGNGKRTAEHLCALYHRSHGLQVASARCFAFVGPLLPLDAHFAIGNFIRDALADGPVRVAGDGSPRRSYLYASDLAEWLWTLLLRGGPCRAYNVGSERVVSIAELARVVAGLVGTEVAIARPETPGRPAERYVPSTARARVELGLRERVGLEEAIRRTILRYEPGA